MRDMEKNGASTIAHARPKIEIDHAYQIIKAIVTPKGLGAEAMRELYQTIVGG